jgi:transcriptional regulator with XRE-family HTH domain
VSHDDGILCVIVFTPKGKRSMAKGNGARVVAGISDSVRAIRAARLRAARAHAGIGQEEVAEYLGVSTGTVKRMENGKPNGGRDISLEEMLRVAELCDVPPAFMVQGFQAVAPVTLEDAHRIRDEITAAVAQDMSVRFSALARALLREHEARALAHEAIEHLAQAD